MLRGRKLNVRYECAIIYLNIHFVLVVDDSIYLFNGHFPWFGFNMCSPWFFTSLFFLPVLFPVHTWLRVDSQSLIFFFQLFFFCREALPRLDNYRLSLRAFKRPSISLLHGEVLEHIPVSSKQSLLHCENRYIDSVQCLYPNSDHIKQSEYVRCLMRNSILIKYAEWTNSNNE